MFRSYILRFLFRLGVLIAALIVYIRQREALDFTIAHNGSSLLRVLWLVLLVSFALQLSPHSRVSRGCRKQFPQTFERIEATIDHFNLRKKLKILNLGATRVAIIWILLNSLIGWLYYRKILGIPEMLLLSVFYYLCDVICIVFYCPFQKIFMKNKCCVTCRIFAWGTIMTVTPLIFIPHFYSWSLVALALICTVLWEITYHRHPERFCEETNAFLTCSACTDHLCVVKRALEKKPQTKQPDRQRSRAKIIA